MAIRHQLKITPPLPGSGGINQLVAAAVISRSLQDLLLVDPLAAARQGYDGEPIVLSPEEEALLLSVSGAESLVEFCVRLVNHRGKNGQ